MIRLDKGALADVWESCEDMFEDDEARGCVVEMALRAYSAAAIMIGAAWGWGRQTAWSF